MTFPTIRPEDVPRIPMLTIKRLRRQLADECAQAAVRNRQILAARRYAEQLDVPADPDAAAHAASIDTGLPNPESVVLAMRVHSGRRTERRRADRESRVAAHLHRPAADIEGRAS